MISAIITSCTILAAIVFTDADTRFDFTSDALAEKWKSAKPLHNFIEYPGVVPMYNFVPTPAATPLHNFR